MLAPAHTLLGVGVVAAFCILCSPCAVSRVQFTLFREATQDSAIRTIGQGVFCAFRHMAGCCALFGRAPHALPETDATVRPVLKHGPRSSTGLQVAARQVRVAKRKQLRLVGRLPFGVGRTTGQLSIRREFDLARAAAHPWVAD